MLVPDSEMPGGERVKILDFGIAKGVTEYSGPAAEDYRTNTGMVLGTATYMAPEQCKGAGNVTTKADVYSLGVIMYRMCCGQLPFRAEGQGEVMAMHIFSTAKMLRDHDASIPPAMNDLVQRMMSKDPADRPTMLEVVQDLDKMVSSTTSPAQPVVVMVADPAPESSGASSTLSAALGQSGRMKALSERAPRKPRLWLGVLGVAAMLAIGLGVRFGVQRLRPAVPPPQSVVTWNWFSTPAGAQVLRKKDGQLICETPCSHVPEPGVGQVAIVVHAPGYVDEEFLLEETKIFSQLIQLRPLPKDNGLSSPVVPIPGASGEVKETVPTNPPPAVAPAIEPVRPTARTSEGPAAAPPPPSRVPGEPGVKATKSQGSPWPKRIGPGRSSEGILTDEKIQIIH